LSVSIGVAFYPDHSLTAEEWIQASQEALAQARGSGAQGLAYSAHQPQAEPENSSPTSG
jgi:GGDEF domain-containing protein